MDADRRPEELESPEALRELVLSQRRQLDALRRDHEDVALLLDALEALLRVERDEDPFASVFAILSPVFRFSHAMVLVEDGDPGSELACVVATDAALVDGRWAPHRFFEKVLSGRVTTTMGSEVLATSPAAAGVVSADQPALYLPLGVRRRRGLMALLRDPDDEGFDRRDVTVGRKFSLLASHALAALSANRSETERRRLHELTEELKAAQATLAHRANHDELTGLPNRAYLEERVARALAAGPDRPLAMAFIDLDGFKQVNDRFGHSAGDMVLAEVARRILAQIRSTDTLARISGDEFVLLIDPLEGEHVIDAMVDRILAELREPFAINGTRVVLSASIGVAVHPDHGRDYEELRRNADLAMYAAKSRAKGSAARFEPALGRAAAERAESEQTVRRAAADGRFRPVLQPIVDLASMDVTGFEVLARMEDEEGRLRPPDEFIWVAGQLGVLDAITLMLVEQVTDSLPALDACFGDHLSLSLNVSSRQALDVAGMRRLLDRLEATGHPQRFVVEVTEDAYLHAGAFQSDVVPLLRDRGVRVSIDDFGTGYASLARLLDLTADELKVDRAFITDVPYRTRSQVILRGVALAAKALGTSLVAEGIETRAELDYVRTVPGIERAQGYLLATPAPAEQLVGEAGALMERLRSLHPASAAAS